MSRNVTKLDLAHQLAAEHNMPVRQAVNIIDTYHSLIERSLLDPEARIELRGFGIWSTRKYAPRQHETLLGEVNTPAQERVKFRPSNQLNDRVQTARRLAGDRPVEHPLPPAPPPMETAQ